MRFAPSRSHCELLEVWTMFDGRVRLPAAPWLVGCWWSGMTYTKKIKIKNQPYLKASRSNSLSLRFGAGSPTRHVVIIYCLALFFRRSKTTQGVKRSWNTSPGYRRTSWARVCVCRVGEGDGDGDALQLGKVQGNVRWIQLRRNFALFLCDEVKLEILNLRLDIKLHLILHSWTSNLSLASLQAWRKSVPTVNIFRISFRSPIPSRRSRERRRIPFSFSDKIPFPLFLLLGFLPLVSLLNSVITGRPALMFTSGSWHDEGRGKLNPRPILVAYLKQDLFLIESGPWWLTVFECRPGQHGINAVKAIKGLSL